MARKFITPILCSDLRHVGVATGVTSVSTTSTTYVSLGTDDLSATLPYPPSGVVSVSLRASISGNTLSVLGLMSFEIRDTNASGTQRVAANDNNSIYGLSKAANESLVSAGMTHVVTGLPTSGTLFIRAMYRSNSGANTAAFVLRGLAVQPSP